MNYKFTKDNKKVAVVGRVNSTQVIVQDVYYIDGDENRPTVGGEPYTYSESCLFEEPVKPAEWRWLQQDKDAWNKERYALKFEVEREKNKINNQLHNLRGISKYLSNIAKEPQEKKVKEVVSLMSALYSTRKKWLIVFGCCAQPEVTEFYSLADDNVLGIFTEGGDMRLLSINTGASKSEVYIALASYSDGSGNRKRIAIVDDEREVHNLLQEWLNDKKEYSLADFEYAKRNSLTVDYEKVKCAYKKRLEYRQKDYAQYTEYLQVCERDIKEAEKALEAIS